MLFLTLPDKYLIDMGIWLAIGLAALVVLILLRRSTRGLGRTLIHACLSAWFLLAIVTLLELGVALFYDTTDSFNRTNVSKRWFQRHVDAQQRVLQFRDGTGIRYRASSTFESPPAKTPHICFVGDSFTFGHGVPDLEKRFSDQIANDFAAADRHIQVSNLAKPGSDLLWCQELTRELFENDYDIDILVYVVCLNDIETFASGHMSFYADIGSTDPKWRIFSETYFLNLVYFRMFQFTRPEIRGYYDFVREFYSGEPWNRMRDTLDELRDLCHANDCELRVAVFPFLHNLGEDYPFAEAHHTIVSHCDAAGIAAMDLRPALEPHIGKGLVVNPFDAHPNATAHRLAATAIREDLLKDFD